jgi:hypothetical protein
VLLAGLLAVVQAFGVAGCLANSSGPPLVILGVSPRDGGGLPLGQPVTIRFNLPFDEASLAARLKIQPSRELELIRDGPTAGIVIQGAAAGQSYTLSVGSGVAGLSGERLREGVEFSFMVTPAGQEPDGGGSTTGPGGGGTGTWDVPSPVCGARLYLDGQSIFACDLSGSYDVPHFDRVRLYLSRPPEGDEASRFVLLEVGAGGELRGIPAESSSGQTWVQLDLQEETLTGLGYELQLLPAPASSGQAVLPLRLYSWVVGGTPNIHVWSLRLSSGKVAPVARLDLGYEVSRLVGRPGGPVFAVGNPGGMGWQGLEIVQALDQAHRPSGPAVAVYAETNNLPAQTQGGDAGKGTLIVVGPAGGIPPLVGDRAWRGYVPGSGLKTPGGLDEGADAADEPALTAMWGEAQVTLLRGSDVGAKFISGGSISPDGGRLAFVSYGFSGGTLVKLWLLDLPERWDSRSLEEAELLPREMARALYPELTAGQFTYGGGATWGGGGSTIWWDICLGEDLAEVWQVDPATGQRVLFARQAAGPMESPDGGTLLYRTSAGPVVSPVEEPAERPVRPDYSWACWTPDGQGLLLLTGGGLVHFPLGGEARQVVGFPSLPGCFVGEDEYWFVSDRRF